MNQNDFRSLVSSGSSQGEATSRGSYLPRTGWGSDRPAPKPKIAKGSQSTFKPRKVKKTENEESPAERAEPKRLNVEEYEKLGTAKGLDLDLLERNRAILLSSADDDNDDALEDIFRGRQAATEPPADAENTVPQKRTRQDIIAELKNKRARGEITPNGELAIAPQGRFKPIGAPETGKKVKKVKKKKPVGNQQVDMPNVNPRNSPAIIVEPVPKTVEEPVAGADDDVDIFAGVDEYEGLGYGDDDDEGNSNKEEEGEVARDEGAREPIMRNWFGEEAGGELKTSGDKGAKDKEEELPSSTQLADPQLRQITNSDLEEPPSVEKLQPLASSSIRSISAFIEADKEFEEEEKRKAKRDKRKGRRAGA